jgi:hypothetical protein
MGSERIRTPVASKMALPMAGANPTIGHSPARRRHVLAIEEDGLDREVGIQVMIRNESANEAWSRWAFVGTKFDGRTDNSGLPVTREPTTHLLHE